MDMGSEYARDEIPHESFYVYNYDLISTIISVDNGL